MKTAKFVIEVNVVDPDTSGLVQVSIFKHQNGGMFGIDSSYIEQVLPEEGDCKISDPLNEKGKIKLLDI